MSFGDNVRKLFSKTPEPPQETGGVVQPETVTAHEKLPSAEGSSLRDSLSCLTASGAGFTPAESPAAPTPEPSPIVSSPEPSPEQQTAAVAKDAARVLTFIKACRGYAVSPLEIAGATELKRPAVMLALHELLQSGDITGVGLTDEGYRRFQPAVPEPEIVEAPMQTDDEILNAKVRKMYPRTMRPPVPPERTISEEEIDAELAEQERQRSAATLTPEERAKYDALTRDRREINPQSRRIG